MLRRPSRTTVFTATATALSLLGDQALYALLPLYFQEIGLLPIQVGILLSANRWIRLFTNHLAERLVGRFPAHLMLAASLALGALLTAVYAVVSSFLILLIARCLWGLCWSFIRHIGVMGVAALSEPKDLGQMMGFYNGISRIGSVVGIVLGGILFDLFGFTTTLVVFCLCSFLAIPFALSSGIQSVGTRNTEWKERQLRSGQRALLICGFCIGSVGPGLLMSTLGFILLSRYGHEVDLFGILIGIATLNGLLLGCRWILDTLGAPFYGVLIDRVGLHIGAPLCFVTGVAVMLLLSMSNSLAALATGIIVFFMCGTALFTVVSAEASRRGSRIYARYATAGDLGAAFGPVIGWTAYELLDIPDLAFILGALLYTIGLLAALTAFKRQAPIDG
ncbi:MAG: MFS transporter [Gammaproteobacteria bacterium]|nr:MFS transporter [Gammaproteobacteria bacterium]